MSASSAQPTITPAESTGEPLGSGATPPVAPPPKSSRGLFAAFKYPNYRLFFWGQIVSLVGSWMNQAAEGWLVYQLTGSKALLGVVAAAGSAPMIVLSTWGGWMADRYPKRTIIVICQWVSMFLSLALAALVWRGHIQPWHIVGLALLGGVVMSFDMPARQSFVVEITSKEDLTNAISLNSSMVNGARIFGPALAGLIMAQFGIAFCFLLDGVSFLAVIASLLMMRLAPHVRPTVEGSPLAHALGGFKYVWEHPRILTVLLLFAVVAIFGWSYSVLMPAFAKDVLHLEETAYGMLLGALGLGAVGGALVVAGLSHRFAARSMALGGVWLFSGMLGIFAWNRSYPVALLLMAAVGCGLTLFFSTSNAAVQLGVPDHMRGRVMGVWTLVFGGMWPLGALQAGFVAQHLGVPGTMSLGAIICAVAALVTLGVVRARDRRAASQLPASA